MGHATLPSTAKRWSPRATFTKWRKAWKRKGWITGGGQPVANKALVVAIDRLMETREAPVEFVKVPGHDPGNRWPLNTAADLRAGEAAAWAARTGQARVFP